MLPAFLTVSALMLLIAPASRAQYAADLRSGPFASIDEATASASSRADLRFGDSRDHRVEGALIGGLVLGIGGALLASAVCSTSDAADKNCGASTLKTGLLLGAAGALTGALVGRLFPKSANSEETPNRER